MDKQIGRTGQQALKAGNQCRVALHAVQYQGHPGFEGFQKLCFPLFKLKIILTAQSSVVPQAFPLITGREPVNGVMFKGFLSDGGMGTDLAANLISGLPAGFIPRGIINRHDVRLGTKLFSPSQQNATTAGWSEGR